MNPALHADHHPLRGVLLVLSAALLFAGMESIAKVLVALYPAPLVVGVRYAVHALLMVALLAPSQGTNLLRTRRTGLVLLRAAALAACSLLVALALQTLPVAETTSIVFLSPLVVVLLARPLLGETIGPSGWLAAVTGFGGVLLVVRPGGGLDTVGVLYAMGAAAGSVVYFLLSRVLAATESTLALLFNTALVGTLGCGLLAPWYWGGPAPTGTVALLFVAMGATAGAGHLLLTAAYRLAPASLLAPVIYLQLLWAGLLGWLVFDHVPDRLGGLGMGVIAAAGLLLAFKSRPARAHLVVVAGDGAGPPLGTAGPNAPEK